MTLRLGFGVVTVVLLLAGFVRGEELRSHEGVAIPLPEGWQRRTAKLQATTVLAVERPGTPLPATIVVNSLGVQQIDEEKAFKETRDLLQREGDIVTRGSGRFLRVDLEYTSKDRRGRLFAAVREKRLFYFILTTTAEGFERDAAVLDDVTSQARFFPAEAKPEPIAPVTSEAPTGKPVHETADAPKTPSEPRGPKQGDATANPPKVDDGAAKTDAPKPDVPKPDVPKPDKEKPDPFVHARPTDGIDPAKADAAAVATPATAIPEGMIRVASKENLLVESTLVARDSEYDPELFAARHLVDGSRSRGWCSSPTTKAPHRFVFQLAAAIDVARVTFDNACPEDMAFEGAASREVVIEGSTKGAEGPWRNLAHLELERGRNDQSVELAQNQVRWLRVVVFTNFGHPTLTQLKAIRAYAAELAPAPKPTVKPTATDEGPFRLERLRLAKEKNGPAVEPPVFAAGDTCWVYFKPRALRLDGRGEYSLEVDVKIEDANGAERLSQPKVIDHRGKPPRAPLSPSVNIRLELLDTFPPGIYTVIVIARDREAAAEAREKIAVEVVAPAKRP